MGESILMVAVLLLSLYGCVELIRYIALRILKNGNSVSPVLVLPVSGHCQDMEFVVRAAVSRSRWISDSPGSVLIIDIGMDDETRILAKKICDEFSNVSLGVPTDCEKLFAPSLQ